MRGGVVGVVDFIFRSAGAPNPLMEEVVNIRRGGMVDRFFEVGGYDVLSAISFQVVMQAAEKIVVAQFGAQHFQHPAAFVINVAGVFDAIGEIARDDRDGIEALLPEPAGLIAPEFVSGFVGAVTLLGPIMFEISGEAFVEPNVGPVFARDQVAEPLVREFVGIKIVGAASEFGREGGSDEAARGERGGAGIFHAAFDEIVYGGLRVLRPGVGHAELIREKIEHLARARESGIDSVFLAARNDVTDRDSAPRVFLFDEFAGDRGDQIRGQRFGLFPIPGFGAVGFIFYADEVAVGNCEPGGRHGENHFGGGAVVRVIVNGNVVAGVFGFALGPDFFWAIGIIFIGEDKVEALLRLAFVADEHLVMFALAGRASERDDQRVICGGKFRVFAIESDRGNFEFDGIELDLGEIVTQHGDGVGDFTAHLALVGIEPEMGLHILQVVIAAAGVGLIGTSGRRKKQRERQEQNTQGSGHKRTKASGNLSHSYLL